MCMSVETPLLIIRIYSSIILELEKPTFRCRINNFTLRPILGSTKKN